MQDQTTQSSLSSLAKGLARVIVRSREALSDQRIYSLEDTAHQAQEWETCLDRSLPADRIEDCYMMALRRRDSNFPLAVTELNEAWRIIKGEEMRPGPPPCESCLFEQEGGRPCRFHSR